MNRIFLVSVVGLGALSAAVFAGSRGQCSTIASCTSSCGGTPVVVVTQPDGSRLSAQCVSFATCDPTRNSGQGGSYSITTSTGSSSCGEGEGSGSSSSCTTAPLVVRARGNATLLGPLLTSDARQHLLSLSARAGQMPKLVEPVEAVELDLDDEPETDAWRAELEEALAEARENLAQTENTQREAWQEAMERAREAQERAREEYQRAMERARDAMQQAAERDREKRGRERQILRDRRAAVEERMPRVYQLRGDENRDAGLADRIAVLEKLARERGWDGGGDERSLEDRVADLEQYMRGQRHDRVPFLGGLFGQGSAPGGPSAPRARALAPSAPRAPKAVPAVPVAPFVRPAPAPDPILREQIEKQMNDLRAEADRLRAEIQRMRSEVERLPERGR